MVDSLACELSCSLWIQLWLRAWLNFGFISQVTKTSFAGIRAVNMARAQIDDSMMINGHIYYIKKMNETEHSNICEHTFMGVRQKLGYFWRAGKIQFNGAVGKKEGAQEEPTLIKSRTFILSHLLSLPKRCFITPGRILTPTALNANIEFFDGIDLCVLLVLVEAIGSGTVDVVNSPRLTFWVHAVFRSGTLAGVAGVGV